MPVLRRNENRPKSREASAAVNPGRMRRRVAACLAAVGFVVAAYLAGHQARGAALPWDPVFGPESSVRVLHSAVSRALPVRDAALGALGYALEVILALAAESPVWRRSSVRRALYGALASAMALGGIGLMVVQAAFVRSFCFLCLVSSALSCVIAVLALLDLRHETDRRGGDRPRYLN